MLYSGFGVPLLLFWFDCESVANVVLVDWEGMSPLFCSGTTLVSPRVIILRKVAFTWG